MGHCRRIRIEGFQLDRLLSECIKSKLDLRNIRVEDNLSLVLTIADSDYKKLLRLAGKKYRITCLEEWGYVPLAIKLMRKKATVIGILLFLFLMYYQSLFISEIRIDGYERLTEAEIRQSLRNVGIYEGCRKEPKKTETVKLQLFEEMDGLAWVGIDYKGGLVEVYIAETTPPVKKVDKSKPSSIIATKDGYIAEIIAREGVRTVSDGAFVRKGDVVINGMIPIKRTALGGSSEEMGVRYVHAEGQVTMLVPERFLYRQERYETVKTKTGRSVFGLHILFGDKSLDTTRYINPYEISCKTEKKLFEWNRPFPLKVAFSKAEEVTLSKRERSQAEAEAVAQAMLRTQLKEKFPENTQIINKSLNFTREKNIIEISAMVQTLQEIGEEQEIIFGESKITE